MRNRYKVISDENLYFITSSIVDWIPVFCNEKYFEILISAVKYSQHNKGLKVYAYVLLDNHFHMIVSGNKLSNIIRSIKSYSAKEIIEQLKKDKRHSLLDQFKVNKLNHKRECTNQVWQEGYHPQAIISEDMLEQKAAYIHLNPVKRGLVLEPEQWRYTSAQYYESGRQGVIKIDEIE